MPRPIATYGFALAAIVAAGVARWLLSPWLGPNLPFLTFYLAVIFAAWFGGFKPGLLAVVLGFVEGSVAFGDPLFAIPKGDLVDLLERVRFVVVGLSVSVISEALHRQRRKAQAQTELMRVTLASIGDAVITTDEEGRITFLNAIAETVTGWTPREALGLELDRVFRIVGEESRQPVESPATRALRDGVVIGPANHALLTRRDGTSVPVDHSASPIRARDGAIVGCVLAFRDITREKLAAEALRESERRFRTMAESLPLMVFTYTADGVLDYASPRWTEFSGLTLADTAGEGAGGTIHPDDREASRAAWAEALRSGDAYESEFRCRRRDGVYRWLMSRAVPLRDDEGRVTKWIGTSEDLDDLHQAQHALREADRRKDEFLATLAHELRNPLAPIRYSLELLKRAGGDADVIQQARSTMERQVLQLVRLVDDLIDVGRITRNKLDLKMEYVELASVVHHAVEASRPDYERAGHELTITLPAQTIYLHADPIRLAQVFENLLTNACKFTEPGGHVWLTAGPQGRDIVVAVKDTGVGIPPDMLPTVFDLFTQVDRSLERTAGGLGIGLSLVKRLVEMHGGSVEAFSEGLGKGSEFVVRLPIVDEKPDAAAPEPAAAPETERPLRILIVDDNRDAAASLSRLLTMAGHETHTAHDGLEAWEAAEHLRPEAMLLDIGLPKLSGYELCRLVRDQPWGRDMVLIALTGWGQDADRRRSREAGFDGHVVKPVDHAALENLLQKLCPPRTST
jgi:PAS domain S-box-containing protein